MELPKAERTLCEIALLSTVLGMGCVNYTPMAVPPPPKPPPDEVHASASRAEDLPSSADQAGEGSRGTSGTPEIEITELELPLARTGPRVSIRAPKEGQSLYEGSVAEAKVEALVTGDGAARLWLGIDDRRPIEIQASKPTVFGALVRNYKLALGHHSLFAVATDAEGHPIVADGGPALARVGFWVGTSQPDHEAEPALVVWPPRPDGDALIVDWVVTGVLLEKGGHTIEVRVSPSDGRVAEHRSAHAQPLSVRGLPPGEVKVAMSIRDAEGKPLPGALTHVERLVDLPASAPSSTVAEPR